jgi:hypothetical protein
MSLGGGSSVNWAASTIMYQPFLVAQGAWDADEEDGSELPDPIDEVLDDDVAEALRFSGVSRAELVILDDEEPTDDDEPAEDE